MYNIHLYNKYIFLDEYTSDLNYIFSSLKKVNIIYYPQSGILTDELNKINLFCKKRKIKLFVINNFRLAVKIKADGLYLTSSNKTPVYSKFFKSSFKLIGSSHNQTEYFFKLKQNCLKIFLSPLFYNNKYSRNKILNICKFNLVSINWHRVIVPLGGINEKNFGKLKMLKFRELGLYSFLKTLKNPQS